MIVYLASISAFWQGLAVGAIIAYWIGWFVCSVVTYRKAPQACYGCEARKTSDLAMAIAEEIEANASPAEPIIIKGAVIDPTRNQMCAVVLMSVPNRPGTVLAVRTCGPYVFYERDGCKGISMIKFEQPRGEKPHAD